MKKTDKTIILGIGNILQKDDGIGVYASEYLLLNYTFTPNLTIINGGVEGIKLLDLFIENRQIIVIDTIMIDDKAGSIYNIPAEKLGGYGLNSGSAHEIGVLQCLDMLDMQDLSRPQANIIGIIPQEITFEFALSQTLIDAFEGYIKVILSDLKSKGFEATKNNDISLEQIINKFKDPSSFRG